MSATPLIFDLDGTLVDSVYLHAAAFQRALFERGIRVPTYEVHKRIGMTGELLLHAINEAFNLRLSDAALLEIDTLHASHYKELRAFARAVPGATELWPLLKDRDIPFAIATSAGPDDAKELCELVNYPQDGILITKETPAKSKPAPGSFERAAKKLHVDLKDAIIVGDSVWDMLSSRRARSLGIGVLTGGYGREELEAAGAFRVYNDIADMSRKLDELGL